MAKVILDVHKGLLVGYMQAFGPTDASNVISPTVSVSMYHCICSRTGYTGQAAILRFPRFLRYYNFDLFFDRLDAALPFPTFVRLSRWVPGYPGRWLKGDISTCVNLWNLCWKGSIFLYLAEKLCSSFMHMA